MRLEWPRGSASCATAPLPLLDPAPAGAYRGGQPDAAGALRGGGGPRRGADPRRRAREDRAGPRGRGPRAARPRPRAPCSASCARRFRRATCSPSGRGDATFIGASPELLVRREGQRASTVALAGLDAAQRRPGGRRPPRRAAAPERQGPRGERDRGAADRAGLAGRTSVWVTAAPEPALVQVANIQHLARPIRAQLAAPIGAIELAGLLHPDAGRRRRAGRSAEQLIPALEGLDRGWYAGPVGWTDATGDGEFCVALRCALLRGAARALLRRLRDRPRFRSGGRAGRDRDQARRAAAGAGRLSRRAGRRGPARATSGAGERDHGDRLRPPAGAARGSRRGRCGPR